ncbi:YggS family pyridoxal phosphate-dependent enzyme [Azospirillum doebereinerae]|uniref:Pyridoxal phosphate homeostasis protein n=1 Tax=Azospirillum doebereinerae TaxID=92933 RepID=A0A3S0V7L2_9PROT|nr:YggS family pyridoxal phosphate-dependent enzyme [Azospirillum doebereinerae]MCG5242805.1 YggS family pyridoxal phosphate-dependent enzyme [Azospirillum doebereinerae]RUQ73803.1 YggS family pyridoxal phosphate-dependent enzyme [Azospirillum doebereinerae]
MTPTQGTDHPHADSVTTRLAGVRRSIAETGASCGRDSSAVTLVAVSKTHPADAVEEALAAGQRVFGENRVQEARGKFPDLKARFPDLELHLIGPLQTNKVKDAVALFDVIQTLDRPRLAEALAEEMAKSGRRPRCLIEVNTGEEPQKAGIPPAEVEAFLADCRDRLGLPVTGLMCIPPVDEEPAMHFALLAEMARRLGLAEISMGMSGDFETAVRFGATHVRVGTAIFGSRPYPAA